MITLTNLNYASKDIGGYHVSQNGSVNVATQDAWNFYQLGFVDETAAPYATTTDVSSAITASVGPDDPGVGIPTTGATVTVGGPQLLALTGIRPAGTLAALTLQFFDGITNGVARIVCTQIITAVTITGNVDLDASRTLLDAPTALAAGQMLEYWWDESGSSPCWIRAQ